MFAEEITKAALEAESEDAAQRTIAAVPAPSLAVPASLHASLMARLDRLGHAKEVAQIGAAIGREFSYGLISAVARKPEAELGSALNRLVQAGLLFHQGITPHATYLFKHALVQDAAYGTLLREPRRALHARIAETLESQFAELTETRPELLARQYSDAGLIEKAAGLWGKAGQRSLGRFALIEAVAQFTRGLDQLASLPASPVLRREQIRLQVRDKSRVRPSPRDDRAGGGAGRGCRRPAPSLFRPLRFLHSEVHQLRRRCCLHACAAIPRAPAAATPFAWYRALASPIPSGRGTVC